MSVVQASLAFLASMFVCVSDVFDYHQIWKKTGDGVWNENTMSFGVLALIEQFGFSIVSELV